MTHLIRYIFWYYYCLVCCKKSAKFTKREPTRPYHAFLPRANLALCFHQILRVVSYRQPYALRISGLTSHPLKLSALPEIHYTQKWHCSRIKITLRNRPDSQSSTSDARDPELLIIAVRAPSPHHSNFHSQATTAANIFLCRVHRSPDICNYVWRNPYR